MNENKYLVDMLCQRLTSLFITELMSMQKAYNLKRIQFENIYEVMLLLLAFERIKNEHESTFAQCVLGCGYKTISEDS